MRIEPTIGRVLKLEMDYKDSGTVMTKICLGVKKGKDAQDNPLYDNFYITFFNKRNYPTAEKLGELVKEGDYIRVEAELTVNKYTPQGAEKPKYSMQLIGWGFKKVKFDKTQNKWVDIEEEES